MIVRTFNSLSDVMFECIEVLPFEWYLKTSYNDKLIYIGIWKIDNEHRIKVFSEVPKTLTVRLLTKDLIPYVYSWVYETGKDYEEERE